MEILNGDHERRLARWAESGESGTSVTYSDSVAKQRAPRVVRRQTTGDSMEKDNRRRTKLCVSLGCSGGQESGASGLGKSSLKRADCQEGCYNVPPRDGGSPSQLRKRGGPGSSQDPGSISQGGVWHCSTILCVFLSFQ